MATTETVPSAPFVVPPVDYVHDVRPLLSGKCYACHGPDKQEGGLRLDVRESLLAPAESGDAAVTPGKAESSELIARVRSDDPDVRMPRGKPPLEPQQIALLERWIADGAPLREHWADVRPVRPPLPPVRQASWPRQPIDYFVLARLEAEGLAPNEEADRYHLVRRLYLDLIGLPPSVREVDAFVADERPDACERLVDRLLASPRFGERWARWWLDLARYADTNGYESDEPRTMWPYRDWVIGALNENMPFDRFTIEQLAGDLLGRGGEDQLIASGFHRNSLINTEGGAKQDEFWDAAIKDRVETTATVWLGSTIGCAQCHNHKYDPFTQADYYRLYAFFHNTTDKAVAEESDSIPVFFGDHRELAALEREWERLEELLSPDHPGHADDRAKWEKEMCRKLAEGEFVSPVPQADVVEAFSVEPEQRTERQTTLINAWYRQPGVSPRLEELRKQRDEAFKKIEEYKSSRTANAMIMKEGSPQPTCVQIRGNFLDLGEQVQPGVPAVYGVPLTGERADRLALARWLVDPNHPRTARVTVNRLWDVLFGEGIVATSDDFGTQGDLPSHPELLDWLAVEFVESGWDVKRLLRTIVTSATYRQSSRITPEKLDRDRYNRLLARGPRFRVEAETVRDIAMGASGLLCNKLGGPSVFPPQPDVIFENLFIEGGFQTWPESSGEDRYRRGVYTFVKRTALHPMLGNFDAPNRSKCAVHRKRSNTPSAALNTLNGPAFVEASGALAARMARHEGDVAARITYGFRLCATRPPRQQEVAALAELYRRALARFQNDPAAAQAAVAEGRIEASEIDGELHAAEMDEAALAAWMAVANTLLNMDATLSKG